MTAAVAVEREDFVMPDNLKNDEDMMPADSGHPWSRRGAWEFEPISSKPQFADVLPESFNGGDAAATSHSGTPLGVLYDARLVGFHARAAYDRRCYLVGLAAIAVGLAVMLGALALLGPNWLTGYFAAPSHVAINDSWCLGFDGLSCKQQDTARE